VKALTKRSLILALAAISLERRRGLLRGSWAVLLAVEERGVG